MTCAKQTVRCTITNCDETESVTATNYCERPQTQCPRAPGEGYAKCELVCQQGGHAEIQALALARKRGLNVYDGVAYVSGHYYGCEPCARALRDAGIRRIVINVKP